MSTFQKTIRLKHLFEGRRCLGVCPELFVALRMQSLIVTVLNAQSNFFSPQETPKSEMYMRNNLPFAINLECGLAALSLGKQSLFIPTTYNLYFLKGLHSMSLFLKLFLAISVMFREWLCLRGRLLNHPIHN